MPPVKKKGSKKNKKTPTITPKKTIKKRSKLSTSFKRNKLTPTGSGKVFKKNRGALKRLQQSVTNWDSASSTNANTATPIGATTRGRKFKKRTAAMPVGAPVGTTVGTPVRTPLGTPVEKPVEKRLGTPGSETQTPSSAPESETKTQLPSLAQSSTPSLPIPVQIQSDTPSPSAFPSPVQTLGRVSRKKAKQPRLPIGHIVKDNVGDMFRNYYSYSQGFSIRAPVSSTIVAEPNLDHGDDDDIIVIEDELETNDENNGNVSAVETLGYEMLGLVDGENNEPENEARSQAVPDTPRTIIRKKQWLQEPSTSEEVLTKTHESKEDGEDTIELNDTITIEEGDDVDESDDEIQLVEEVSGPHQSAWPTPLAASNIQNVLQRYQKQTLQQDFIPLQSPGQRKRQMRNANASAERAKRRHVRPLSRHRQGPGEMGFITQTGRRFMPEREGGSGAGDGQTGEKRNLVSQGPTMYVGEDTSTTTEKSGLRPIVIDGSNVAMAHGRNKVFSSKGIKMVVDFFSQRGHEKIVAFVPQFRNKYGQVQDKPILEKLEEEGHVVFTPSRQVGNQRITSYDDTFVLDYAAKHGGVVITRDNYKDLVNEKPEWKTVVAERILMPTFVGEDDLMWPHDPLGREGPNLDQFLRF